MRLLTLYLVCITVILALGMMFVFRAVVGVDEPQPANRPLLLQTGSDVVQPGRAVHAFTEEAQPATAEVPEFSPPHDWQPYRGRTLNFGNRQQAVWLHFSLINIAEQPFPVFLELGWPYLHKVSLWTKTNGGAVSGRADTMFQRITEEQDYRHPLFPFMLAAGAETEIYIHAESSAKLIIPLILWGQENFLAHRARLNVWFAGFFAAITVMLIYNFFLCNFTRDWSYLLYCIYVCSVLFYVLSFTGLGGQLFWPDNDWLKDHSYGISSSLSFLVVVFFMRSFLSLPTIGGWVLHVSTALAVGWGLLLFLYFVSDNPLMFLAEDVVALSSCGAGLAVTIYLWWQGNVSAKFLTIAWTVLILATLLLMLGLSNIIPYNPVAQYIQMVGFVVEVVLLSIALAERMNRERTAKEIAKQQALELVHEIKEAQAREMVAQRQLLELKESTNLELESRVRRRTRELEKALKALEEANAELATLSITDPLTKIANRRYYEQVLDNEIHRARRADRELSLLMLDIDHFKLVNDNLGHLAGDHCLVQIAGTIEKQVTRPADFVARYGGEEFVVILPETGLQQAVVIAEKMRLACSKTRMTWDGHDISVTVSAGVASTGTSGFDPKRLLEDADRAMYLAKESGRNLVKSTLDQRLCKDSAKTPSSP